MKEILARMHLSTVCVWFLAWNINYFAAALQCDKERYHVCCGWDVPSNLNEKKARMKRDGAKLECYPSKILILNFNSIMKCRLMTC